MTKKKGKTGKDQGKNWIKSLKKSQTGKKKRQTSTGGARLV
jgi:hypothetical protein